MIILLFIKKERFNHWSVVNKLCSYNKISVLLIYYFPFSLFVVVENMDHKRIINSQENMRPINSLGSKLMKLQIKNNT